MAHVVPLLIILPLCFLKIASFCCQILIEWESMGITDSPPSCNILINVFRKKISFAKRSFKCIKVGLGLMMILNPSVAEG